MLYNESWLSAGMHRPRRSRWAELPLELVLLLIRKLVAAAGNDFSAVSDFRGACRAWRAACSQYPAELRCRRLEDLGKLCTAFPQVVALQIPGSDCSARDLEPLSACHQLTRLIFEKAPLDMEIDEWRQDDPLDLQHLPNSLRELSLASVIPASNSFGNLGNVTHVSCRPEEEQQEGFLILLQELPGLRVSNFFALLHLR